MKSWTAPGPDMIHSYWLKELRALHDCLAAQMEQLLMNGTHPDWLIQDQTVLIMKYSQDEAEQGVTPEELNTSY